MGDLSDRMSDGVSCWDFIETPAAPKMKKPKSANPLDDLNTCDKHGDKVYFKTDFCPRCKDERIEKLEKENADLKALCKEADDYLNSMPAPRHNRIAHGSILHGKFAEAWRDFDAHEHDGRPCSVACMGHRSHPCEICGRQWPVKYKGEDE